jgi:hypothetical protein
MSRVHDAGVKLETLTCNSFVLGFLFGSYCFSKDALCVGIT